MLPQFKREGENLMAQLYCEKCNRTMDETNFYTSKNLEKYPNGGKLNLCKKCLTMHVNNWDPSTFLWILEELDLPYIETEWKKLVDTYCKDPEKITGTTVLGRYISKMKLRQWKDYRWKDTEALKQEEQDRKRLAMFHQGYKEEDIEKALAQPILGEVPDYAKNLFPPEEPSFQSAVAQTPEEKNNAALSEIEDLKIENELTSEDKKALFLKWGPSYTPAEWVQLEQLYTSVMQSFDIQTPTHIDYLKLICKTSLKCNQLIDSGDIEGFQKMSRVYDSLMKSAKFTAAQNKAENGEYVDSVGELVALAEAGGTIERYYTDSPKDKVDETLEDMKKYLYKLVTEEQGLGNLVESAIKQLQQQDENDDSDEDEDAEEVEEVLNDLDFEDFNNFIEEEQEKDVDENGTGTTA